MVARLGMAYRILSCVTNIWLLSYIFSIMYLSVLNSAEFKYVEALSRIIIGGPYPPSNAIIYMHLQL